LKNLPNQRGYLKPTFPLVQETSPQSGVLVFFIFLIGFPLPCLEHSPRARLGANILAVDKNTTPGLFPWLSIKQMPYLLLFTPPGCFPENDNRRRKDSHLLSTAIKILSYSIKVKKIFSTMLE
jgi:hypothetical protein